MNRIPVLVVSFLVFSMQLWAQGNAGQEAAAGEVLTLRDAVRMALDRAPEVQLARAEADQAEQALRETRSLNLPLVVTGTGLAYNNGFPLSIEGAAPSIVQAAVSKSILSKKNRNLIREAEEGSKASRSGSESARNDLAAHVALLYSELHVVRQEIPLLRKQRQAAVQAQQAAAALFEAGTARSLDVTLAQVATANVEQQLLVAQERARVAEAGLRAAAGIPATRAIRTERPALDGGMLAMSEDQLYRQALEIHPAVREAEANVRARAFHVEAEKGERYPQITLVGQYALFSKANNYQDYFNQFTRNNYLAGVSIQIPLFDGFRTDARVALSRREEEAARLRLQRLQADLKTRLEQDASDLRIATGAADLARLEVKAAEEQVKISETLLEAGRIDPADLDGMRARLVGKQIVAAEAEKDLFQRQVALLQAGGALATLF